MSGVEPNVRYHVGTDVAYYRLMLPALPSKPGDSHRGTWKAVLGLRKPELDRQRYEDAHTRRPVGVAEFVRRLREFAEKPTPFNLHVHTYSNLTLDATLRQDGFAPGDAVHLTASLWEYRRPCCDGSHGVGGRLSTRRQPRDTTVLAHIRRRTIARTGRQRGRASTSS